MIKVTFSSDGSVSVEASQDTSAFSIIRDGNEIVVVVAEAPVAPAEPSTVMLTSVPTMPESPQALSAPQSGTKIALIKAVRQAAGCGLGEAKEIVESVNRGASTRIACESPAAAKDFVKTIRANGGAAEVVS